MTPTSDSGVSEPVCPLCGDPMQPWLRVPVDWLRPRMSSGPFQLYWCERSQLGRQHPMPSAEFIASLYAAEHYYTHSVETVPATPASAPFADRLLAHLAWRLDRGVNLSADWARRRFGERRLEVCEIGCGNGRLLGELQRAGHTVIGVEPDPQAQALALREFGVRLLTGTLEALPEEVTARQYDLVLMSHVMEHTVDPELALGNAARLLKPGGHLVVETPNNAALSLAWSGSTWFCLRVPEHLQFFTRRSLQGYCEKIGLRMVDAEFSNYCRQFMAGYIETEQRIHDDFVARGTPAAALPARHSRGRAWALFLRSLFVAKERRYDCVRVIAERPRDPG